MPRAPLGAEDLVSLDVALHCVECALNAAAQSIVKHESEKSQYDEPNQPVKEEAWSDRFSVRWVAGEHHPGCASGEPAENAPEEQCELIFFVGDYAPNKEDKDDECKDKTGLESVIVSLYLVVPLVGGKGSLWF